MRLLALPAIAAFACSSPTMHTGSTPAPPTRPVAKSVADPGPPGLRLPGDVRPALYHLDLTIVPADKASRGRVTIDAHVVKPTRVVWLDATGLTIGAATLGGAPARVIPGGDDYIGLTSDRELPAGSLAITIEFTAPIDHEKSRGIYAETEGTETYAYSFFEAIDARRAFPCFDEPSYKIPWQLTFHVKHQRITAVGGFSVSCCHRWAMRWRRSVSVLVNAPGSSRSPPRSMLPKMAHRPVTVRPLISWVALAIRL